MGNIISLSRELEIKGRDAVAPGGFIKYSIGYGDFIDCFITRILTLPVPKDPENVSAGFRYTFHLVLKAFDDSCNHIPIDNDTVYAIVPIEDYNLYIEKPDDDGIPDTILRPEDLIGLEPQQ